METEPGDIVTVPSEGTVVEFVPGEGGMWACHGPIYPGTLQYATNPDIAPFIIGALAAGLGSTGDDEDRPLVHTLVSLDGPRADRVWVDAIQDGRRVHLREAVTRIRDAGHDLAEHGLSPWCLALRRDIGSFAVTPGEFHQRCLPHFRGGGNAWTLAERAQAEYLAWSPHRQAEFHHEFSDESQCAIGEARIAAGRWLQARRRCILQWTIVLRDRPEAPPVWLRQPDEALAGLLQEPYVNVDDAASRQWGTDERRRLLEKLFQAEPSPLTAVLERAGCPAWRAAVIQRWLSIDVTVPLSRQDRSRLREFKRWFW